jgi:alkylhydroperoxidase family enzyme
MPRLPGLDPDQVQDAELAERLRRQIAARGQASGSAAIMARCPAIARAWAAMFGALAASGRIERPLRHLVNRWVALRVGCAY